MSANGIVFTLSHISRKPLIGKEKALAYRNSRFLHGERCDLAANCRLRVDKSANVVDRAAIMAG
ncbi:hypothetical protein [Pseudomonas oryzihabitans]|uniref:hypothetical protein n=1 Tax=Pseudomonas oryzihabitans TaxID=47885 RepID=UPI0028957D57|nr:hypothetical protein [Pseudomonas oryzihabitans]MDT3722522.1 hypothetical protein [Pseudomonas oryzihabitans]